MAFNINKNTELKLSLETIVSLGLVLITITAVYINLKGEIATAKELPRQDITRAEFNLIIESINTQVKYNGEQLEEIKSQLDKLDARLYNLSTK